MIKDGVRESSRERLKQHRNKLYLWCLCASIVLNLLTTPFAGIFSFSSRSHEFMNDESRLSPIATRFLWMYAAQAAHGKTKKRGFHFEEPCMLVIGFGPYMSDSA